MNLLQETISDIAMSGHKIENIIFIGSEESGYSCTWNEFAELANKEYDAGFGSQKVATDLIIVFSDGAKMWRGEYDGSEWWDRSTLFVRPKVTKPIKKLFTNEVGWDDLEEINENLKKEEI